MPSANSNNLSRLPAMSPSRDSISYTSTKGLLNAPGQNNCFLNSAVQVLWHLDIFRRSFRELSGHACLAESCIFCALKELFSQLQFSNAAALPPDALRRALAESFYDQQRFQLGFMDDAAECFENMLMRIHMHIAPGENEDVCTAKHCIPHQKFSMAIVEQSICEACGANSEPFPFTQLIHYVSASALTTQARQMTASGISLTDKFGQLLRKAGGVGDIRECPNSCGAKIQIRRCLINRPEIVSLGIIWDSDRPTLDHIMDVFTTIGTSLRLSDAFSGVMENKWADQTSHNLVGVVTYYGKHYSTFFFHSKLRVWIYFDDATVREVGPRWDQVVEKCRRGRYQPLLLLFAVPGGTPVNTENAPKIITPLPDRLLENQSTLRRSVTPSPEKPNIGNTRRAITPNPEGTFAVKKCPLPRPPNDYQNLSVIQDNLYGKPPTGLDCVDGEIQKEPEYISRKAVENLMNVQHVRTQVHRTLSNGSSSGLDGVCIPEHLNVPRRRDSGNWSGDRNSASSSSSTTMENPYAYLVGKMPNTNGGSVPGSPTRTKSESSNGSGPICDAGYDSYSLSSNDSSAMATVQYLMKQGHLAKIPEDYGNPQTQEFSKSCDVLCDEADELLIKSRQLEDEHDLVLALAVCNAATSRARAAMDAPYNNPQALTLARMKHNTCIMRARSLHRRITQTGNPQRENHPEIRHTREGSSGSGRHSRQNSRDKGQHSRQNSKELLTVQDKPTIPIQQTKSIEIYATLPKKKGLLKSKPSPIDIGEDIEYAWQQPVQERKSRGLLSRSKNKDEVKIKEKRSRSEDRNKISKDFSVAPIAGLFSGNKYKDTLKREKTKDDEKKEEKENKTGKKQHKIRRKLLMGGLIRRKNRSMPDLTEANKGDEKVTPEKSYSSVDDSNVGLRNQEKINNMCGYLSEGHLEFTGSSANPNLERSKLMRKSFHGSAGKVLTAAKVPPPPPLRTTSQLTSNKTNESLDVCNENQRNNSYNSHAQNYGTDHISTQYMTPQPVTHSINKEEHKSHYYSSPHIEHVTPTYSNNIQHTTVVIQADVHQEQSPIKQTPTYCQNTDVGFDEVDCLPSHNSLQNLDLPPYPSPIGSVAHSRQGSAEFPPPPPPLDLSALDEHLPKSQTPPPPPPDSLLAKLQRKRLEIMAQENHQVLQEETPRSSGDTWLKELQAKQEALKMKKNQSNAPPNLGEDVVDFAQPGLVHKISSDSIKMENAKVTSVRDLASKFENKQGVIQTRQPSPLLLQNEYKQFQAPQQEQNSVSYFAQSIRANKCESPVNTGVLSLKKRDDRENVCQNVQASTPTNCGIDVIDDMKRMKPMKKKSVSFCDQVILVATADEQEDDGYIPNPILERVLRTAMHKPDKGDEQDNISEQGQMSPQSEMQRISPTENVISGQPDPMYVRRNSADNILSTGNYPVARNQQIHPYPTGVENGSVNGYHEMHQTKPIQEYVSQPEYSSNHQGYMNHQVRQTPIPNQPYPVTNPQQSYNYQQHPQQIYSPQNHLQNQQSYPYQQPYVQQQPNHPQQQHYSHVPYQQRPPQNLPQQHPVYQHPPSPLPQSVYRHNRQSPQLPPISSYQQSSHNTSPYQSVPQTSTNSYQSHPPVEYTQQISTSPYQRVPNLEQHQPPYQRIPNGDQSPANVQYQRVPSNDPTLPYHQQPTPVYQRIPNGDQPISTQHSPYQRVPNLPQHQVQNGNRQSPYQPVPQHDQQQQYLYQNYNMNENQRNRLHDESIHRQSPYDMYPYQGYNKQPITNGLKKSVSFEPGTKGGIESPVPVDNQVINNNDNNQNGYVSKTKCNLCRKKYVIAPSSYCRDCEFYMSRFRPKS